MAHKLHGRKKPYTEIGISRIPCVRCGQPACYQWQVCADDSLFRPLCKDCDVELNEMVMRWAFPPKIAEPKITAYKISISQKGDTK
jgi:hypothetical protein